MNQNEGTKWYIFRMDGEGFRYWICGLNDAELNAVRKLMESQTGKDVKAESYCGYLSIESGPYETLKDAQAYMGKQCWYDENDYYDDMEEAEIEDFYNYYDYYNGLDPYLKSQ